MSEEARMEASEKARELVEDAVVGVMWGSARITTEEVKGAKALKRALLDYIATLERDHRAMEKVRRGEASFPVVWCDGKWTNTVYRAGTKPTAYDDPADAILGGEDG